MTDKKKTKENVVSVQNEWADCGCRTRLSQAEPVTQGAQAVFYFS